MSETSKLKPSTKIIGTVVVAIIIIIAVVAVTRLDGLGPDLDAIIKKQDCDEVMKLTDVDTKRDTTEQ